MNRKKKIFLKIYFIVDLNNNVISLVSQIIFILVLNACRYILTPIGFLQQYFFKKITRFVRFKSNIKFFE